MERLQGSQYFSKKVLADAYLQLELEDDTKKLCVINTPFGFFQFKYMFCCGIKPCTVSTLYGLNDF